MATKQPTEQHSLAWWATFVVLTTILFALAQFAVVWRVDQACVAGFGLSLLFSLFFYIKHMVQRRLELFFMSLNISALWLFGVLIAPKLQSSISEGPRFILGAVLISFILWCTWKTFHVTKRQSADSTWRIALSSFPPIGWAALALTRRSKPKT